jgi:hypothetical protein
MISVVGCLAIWITTHVAEKKRFFLDKTNAYKEMAEEL